jgi:hypothetical protein
MNSTRLLVTLSISLFLATVTTPFANAVGVFHRDEQPFGKPYEDWVQDWWKWNAAIPGDPVTTFAGIQENGCLINKEGPVVMLIDPAIGGNHHQICEISSNQGILISGWSALCSGATKGNENKSFKALSECARQYNLGKVTIKVWIDNKPVAQAIAEDYKTISLTNNATELYTKGFNITSPENSNLAVDNPGTHLGAAHGWFVFLKPLPLGEHTVRYTNDVRETALGAGNTNNADITYSFTVK